MKIRIRKDYCETPFQEDLLVVPVGEAQYGNKRIIRMNATGKFIWNTIREGADTKEKILEKMRTAYEDLDMIVAEQDLDTFLQTARMALEE